MKLNGKVAVVTGGAQGIGLAVVKDFLDNGASVVFCDIDEQKGLEVERVLGTPRVRFTNTDITSENACAALVKFTENTFGCVDILVNNARASILKSLEATKEDWNLMLGVNITGQAIVTRHIVESMKCSGKGSIVNLGSISGVIAQKNQVTYAVTKAAMIQMSRCLALDLKEYNIRVNAVSPGWVMTENVHDLLYKDWKWDEQRIKAEIGNLHMTGRLAEPDEIAKVITFLASDDASFITGANIMADGGFTAQ